MSAKSARTVLVTGAGSGLGLETARRLGEAGNQVFVSARSLDKAKAAVAKLHESVGASALLDPIALDVSDDASVAALARAELSIDVLINNAGAIYDGDPKWSADGLLSTPANVMLQSIDNNAVGALRVAQALMPGMNARGYGRVVNVSSGMGALRDMQSGCPAYRASKATMNAITILLSHAAAEGVLVNAVCPGWVRTPMGGSEATRSVDEGATGIVWAATLDADGPNGGFFRDGEAIEW